MSDIQNNFNGSDDIGDDDLRAALRQLRRDAPPQRDLWPGIERQITVASRATSTQPRFAVRNRLVPWALAASVLLALGVAWQMQRPQPRSGEARLITHEARAMTREYQGALRVIASSAPASVQADPALRELDRSAALIRGALAKDPDARFLLDRLRHTYAMRLALTQRAALT
jgi:hypothetical protein